LGNQGVYNAFHKGGIALGGGADRWYYEGDKITYKLEITNCDFKLERMQGMDLSRIVTSYRIKQAQSIFYVHGTGFRHVDRFSEDFMFQLRKDQFDNLRYHFGTSSWGGQRHLPYAFTENGVAMLSSVLNSNRAIQVNIQIMRTFNRIRETLFTHKELQRKIDEMENKYDQQFRIVFDAIRELMAPPARRAGRSASK
jgi:hypothetical protein